MSSLQGNVQSLGEGSQESLRGLVEAIIPDINSSDGLRGDAVARLTQRLTELMGPETAEAMKQNHNERGEFVNEEGLPIIDITEAVDLPSRSSSPPIAVDLEPFLPLTSLSLDVRERMREKRIRILALLEEEERQVELLEKERELHENAEILQKRKEEATRQKNGIKEARELQKKMGRALLQNMGQAREKEEQEKAAQRLLDEEMIQRRSPSSKKKSVTFAEKPESHENVPGNESSDFTEWGDITPARLQTIKRPTLASQSLLDRHPMKMSVVERIPGVQNPLPNTPQSAQTLPDSDDESDPQQISDSSDHASDEDGPILEEDEVDFDFVQQQREIAMEYYNKRNLIGQEAASAMLTHTHDTDDQGESSFESSRNGKKTILSQFRANRFAAAYGASVPAVTGPDSVSLGPTVLPPSSARTLQQAIRMGKLDTDGQLVGEQDNSGSEDEEPGMQEVLELLKKGEIYNLGPNGECLFAVHPSSSQPLSQSDRSQYTSNLPSPSRRSGPSKFKASLNAFGRPVKPRPCLSATNSDSKTDDGLSPSMTPVSHERRSSPKLDEPLKAVLDPSGEGEQVAIPLTDPINSQDMHAYPFSMIVDSPSFPKPGIHKEMTSSSFQPTSSRPERPPAVLSSKVYEANRTPSPNAALTSENKSFDATSPKKVSRFKAERM